MEKHKTCKLCSRKFANGRALGGHMRSHMMNLHIQQQEEKQIDDETDSIPSSSWSSEDGEKGKILNSSHSVVVLPDKESETESFKNPTRCKRSKRVRKSTKANFVKIIDYSETEPVSSISETSPEEDVAHCLMMLSRDKWIVQKELVNFYSDAEEEEEEEFKEENSDDCGVQVKVITKTRGRGKYRCETCNKVFRSYQALGGHRASHKKIKVLSEVVESGKNNGENVVLVEEKIHECPVCYRVFSSGQALGGHKRTHAIGAAAATVSVNLLPTAAAVSSAKLEFSRTGGTSLIDLNLPPPIEDDDEIISQVEVSAVSDAEFVNPIKN
ncbi:unnamed protein product [Withania somnifera]